LSALLTPVGGKHLAEAVGNKDCCGQLTAFIRSAREMMYPPILIDQQDLEYLAGVGT